jgi:hypothetical protein
VFGEDERIKAMQCGTEQNQISIFSIHNNDTITTGGNGIGCVGKEYLRMCGMGRFNAGKSYIIAFLVRNAFMKDPTVIELSPKLYLNRFTMVKWRLEFAKKEVEQFIDNSRSCIQKNPDETLRNRILQISTYSSFSK